MDQFAQTNDLQQAIDNVANGGNAAGTDNAPFGVPPMPPADNNTATAPIDMMFTTAPVPEGSPEMPKVEPLVSPEAPTTEPAGPSAEQILSESLNMDTPVTEETKVTEAPVTPEVSEEAPVSDLAGVKQNILKELLPLLDKTEKTPEEKFEIYKDAIETMHDVKTIEGAYRAASQITDETKKADALFTIMEVIDKQ